MLFMVFLLLSPPSSFSIDPGSAGGGSKRLFRKVGDRSSEFCPTENEIRREGSYLYEEFLVTQGTDVKVYALGPNYVHAEARKSPAVDGKVNRDSTGLEVRYPVILSLAEKEISRKITEAFKQTVCGFDILRANGKPYVCDVNGWSFVKNSRKYYDDASQVLAEVIVGKLAPSYDGPLVQLPVNVANITRKNTPAPAMFDDAASDCGDISTHGRTASIDGSVNNTQYLNEELSCVIAVMRHGDRTPKQKIKVVTTEKNCEYLEYYHKYSPKDARKELKVKTKTSLLDFLATTTKILLERGDQPDTNYFRVLRQIKDVLERYEISGFNRKLQVKPTKWRMVSVTDPKTGAVIEEERACELLLIMKWGGDLTLLGREQAETLGEEFRKNMYPDAAGGGVLRLHSTYRHDLKIKASDEGRVMKTAAAFTKGLLELEGHLTPIIATLVTVEEKCCDMLDKGGNQLVKEDMNRYHHYLNLCQQMDSEMTDEMVEKIAPECSMAVRRAMFRLGNPRAALRRMYEYIESICNQLEALCNKDDQSDNAGATSSSIATSTTAARDHVLIKTQAEMQTQVETQQAQAPTHPLQTPQKILCNKHFVNSDPSSSNVSSAGTSPKRRFSLEAPSSPTLSPEPSTVLPPAAPSTPSLASGVRAYKRRSSGKALYLNESYALRHARWAKMYADFYDAKTDQYEMSKVPDVYDMLKFDCLHNSHVQVEGMQDLYYLTRDFADCVVPQEFGIYQRDKRILGSTVCGALLEKIRTDLIKQDTGYMLDHSHADDLGINSMDRSVRTRLYFTSESHLHSILNVLKYPRNRDRCAFSQSGLDLLDEVQELSYLTQVVIRVYKNRDDPAKMRAEIYFTPGAVNDPNTALGRSAQLAPYVLLNGAIDYEDLVGCLDDAIAASDERMDHEDAVDGLSDVMASPVTRQRSHSRLPSLGDLSVGGSGDSTASGTNLPCTPQHGPMPAMTPSSANNRLKV